MNSRLFPAVFAALLVSPVIADNTETEQALDVSVSPATVTVLPAAPGRRAYVLPDLEFRFLLEPQCASGWSVGAVTLSAADSRLDLDTELLTDPAIEAQLTIPASQLAPLPLHGFCELPDESAPATAHATRDTVAAALSAQAALLCVNDDQQRMTYTSAPLDIVLDCAALPDPGPDSENRSGQ